MLQIRIKEITDKIQKIKVNEKIFKTQIRLSYLSWATNSTLDFLVGEAKREKEISRFTLFLKLSLSHQLGTNFHVFMPWNKTTSTGPWRQGNKNDQIQYLAMFISLWKQKNNSPEQDNLKQFATASQLPKLLKGEIETRMQVENFSKGRWED